MNIQKAFQRLKWRFSNGKFEPNENDADALKFIADWIVREKEAELQRQTIFAKMYVYSFIHELHFYKDLKFAQKKLHEVLSQPLDYHYSEFLKKLNDFELESFMKSNGLNKDWIDPDKQQAQQTTISEQQEELKKLVLGRWSKEQVDASLNNQITEAINRYKNLP